MEAIGGYFELADLVEGGRFPHDNGVLLNTGRNALEYIFRSIGEVKRVYLPYYTCEVVLEPFEKLHIPYTFYHINQQFEIVDDVIPQEGEYIIINNYFGIKDAYIQKMSETERTSEHDNHLFKRKQFGAEAGFADFQANEKKLDNQPIRLMSFQTQWILEHIDYDKVVARRKENYKHLHDTLGCINNMSLPVMDTFSCPMVYPLMVNNGKELRKTLIDNKVFVAKYWPNVEDKVVFDCESEMANNVLPIPCDQRYGIEEMNRIIDIIKQKDNL